MKILVSTKETQGQRKNDFCFCNEGEFVHFGINCDRDNGNIDGKRGCQRSVCGLDNHKSTTTFKVVSTKMRKNFYRKLYIKSMVDSGLYKEPLDNETKVSAELAVKQLLAVAKHFKVGSILERQGDNLMVRCKNSSQDSSSDSP
ncbi:MAG: hypothetical protein WC375_00135 [Methanomassiliicoccales archaeon]|jgi:hypothetical protein